MRFLDTDAQCAKVFVTSGNSLMRETGPLRRTGTDPVVGIAQDFALVVDIVARGTRDPDCLGPFIDASKIERREFSSGQVSTGTLLVLKGGATPDAGVPDAGPVDAGVGDGGVDAGAPDGGPEQCGNGADDDLDGKIDCADGDCLRQDCNFGRRCTSIGVCEVPGTELACNDGLDDDNDTAIDCDDDDCNGRNCADTNTCTYGETCQQKLCKPALTNTCMAPNECQQGAGTCLPDAGCGYPPKGAVGCDGGTCSNGECIITFPWAPSNGLAPSLPGTAIVPKVTLGCGVSTFDSDTLMFGNWCSQPRPIPRIINRLGLQNLVVLPMLGLDLQDELRLTGSKPVILAVFGDAIISGELNASAIGRGHGPGAPSDNCLAQGAPGSAFIFSSGGGGGAGFAQVGTRGGSIALFPFTGGLGGGLYLVQPNVVLRGGCAGGDGAASMNGLQAALGGGAGGAVQLSVSGRLTIDGKLSVNGGGGAGGVTFNAGGGGGGSAGGLVLEASLLELKGNTKLTAHGGGGGGGARDGDDGSSGEDGHDNDASVAQGGAKGGGAAGKGGNGGAATAPSAAEDGTTSAAGGGGAGTGRIHLRSIAPCIVDNGRLVSPAPTGNCP